MQFLDGLTNFVKNLGTGKGGHSHYEPDCLTGAELLAAYRTSWLHRKLVDLPVNDALRQWRTWDADEAYEIERRVDLHRQLFRAWSSARLFGGAALFIGTNVQTLSRPINVGAETLRYLNVIPREALTVDQHQADRLASDYGEPERYLVDGVPVHKSRLAIFPGEPNHTDWLGDSVVQSAYQALQTADLAATATGELLPEAKVDVFKIPNMMQNLGSLDGEDKLMRRVSLAQKAKSITNGIMIDSEEEYHQKQISFGGINETLMTLYQLASGASDIPGTRLIGRSASGLNSSGDNEVRDYYDNLAAKQQLEVGPAIANIDALIMRESGAIGYTWNPLWQMSETDKAEVNSKNAGAVQALGQTEAFTDDEVRDFGERIMGVAK